MNETVISFERYSKSFYRFPKCKSIYCLHTESDLKPKKKQTRIFQACFFSIMIYQHVLKQHSQWVFKQFLECIQKLGRFRTVYNTMIA